MDQQLSILAVFDDLRRWETVLTDGTAEVEFLRFAQSQDQNRLQWLTAVQEAQRVQRELDAALQNVAGLETKLYHARRLIETSEKKRKDAEQSREDLVRKITQAHDLLYTENINEATRTKFAFLQGNLTAGGGANGSRQHQSAMQARRSFKHADAYGNEVNSTGSILSDLSVTQSEDDFLEDVSHVGIGKRGMRPHQSSFCGGDANSSVVGAKRSRLSVDGKSGGGGGRRSSAAFVPQPQQQQKQPHPAQQVHQSQLDFGGDKIVASTRVSIPHGNGPITAESVIEAIPQAPAAVAATPAKKRAPPPVPATAPALSAFEAATPVAGSKHATKHVAHNAHNAAQLQPPPPPHSFATRPHSFGARTFLKSDTCVHCQKRIKFGTSALKCRECRCCVHADCRLAVQLACVPASGTSGPVTPKGGAIGLLADYAPTVAPRVPALIVHCVNEIESRGLTEVGIYRVSGAEKDVKALKERFLRGKTVPPLQQCDVHVLCGCVKDFLRNLREPLVPTALWRDFSNAAQSAASAEVVQAELYRAIGHMPAANRDTLAFLMQHFLRIARAEMVKMPASNIAKVFGPTIVGYSSAEPDQHAIFTETIIQASVMEKLLQIPADYWCRYLVVPSASSVSSAASEAYADTARGYEQQYFGTPSVRKPKNKFYATPPYSTITKTK